MLLASRWNWAACRRTRHLVDHRDLGLRRLQTTQGWITAATTTMWRTEVRKKSRSPMLERGAVAAWTNLWVTGRHEGWERCDGADRKNRSPIDITHLLFLQKAIENLCQIHLQKLEKAKCAWNLLLNANNRHLNFENGRQNWQRRVFHKGQNCRFFIQSKFRSASLTYSEQNAYFLELTKIPALMTRKISTSVSSVQLITKFLQIPCKHWSGNLTKARSRTC